MHPTLPYLLTSSDDMLIKLWDWDKVCCSTLGLLTDWQWFYHTLGTNVPHILPTFLPPAGMGMHPNL